MIVFWLLVLPSLALVWGLSPHTTQHHLAPRRNGSVLRGACVVKETTAIEGQKPGTSGVRKRTAVWESSHPTYVENLMQSILKGWELPEGFTVVLGGDGRYYSRRATEKILGVLAANGCGRVLVPFGGVIATPAASALIRKEKADGGVLLTASHNPGGKDGDFGIKFNTGPDGAPAKEDLTDRVYQATLDITEVKTLAAVPREIMDAIFGGGTTNEATSFELVSSAKTTTEVQVVDGCAAYLELLEECFDLEKIATELPSDFKVVIDAMHGAAGPAATRLLTKLLGEDRVEIRRGTPKADFGGCHPDPNLKWASDLAATFGVPGGVPGGATEGLPDFGAALDGDGDRNMILGRNRFVTPSDSLAILAANAQEAIPWFSGKKPAAVARSMPTSKALDRVAEALGIPCFEVPTGWKFFGNLMDKYSPFLCGEESFGTSADHVREKDGLWAVLAWLSALAASPSKSVTKLVEDHWRRFGRDLYVRYDFEGVDAIKADAMIDRLRNSEDPSVTEFEYEDPVDGSVSSRQGIVIDLGDASRAVFRLSGTGSDGATIRLYLEKFIPEPDDDDLHLDAATALKDLGERALHIADLTAFTGREHPDVIT